MQKQQSQINLNKINHQLTHNQKIDPILVLETLVEVYEGGMIFMENLHNNDEWIRYISEDLTLIGNYMPTIGMAKSIADALLEKMLSKSDEKWRKNELADYKQSSKSSTTHQINLRGLEDNHIFSLISKELTTLYFDMNRKFDILKTVGSNRKFELEKGVDSCDFKHTPAKFDVKPSIEKHYTSKESEVYILGNEEDNDLDHNE